MKRLIGVSLFGLGCILVLLVMTTQTTAENPKFEIVSGFMTNTDMLLMGDFWFDGAGNLHRRGWQFEFVMESSDPRLDGAVVIDELNGNWIAAKLMDGEMWGKIWITQTDGSRWEGSWTGRVIGGNQQARGVLKGVSGSIMGKKFKIILEQIPGSSPSVFDWTGEIH
ncbi:MAG: hypothetical protein WBB73_06730 [Candidatus Aminicenantaceae bacterium]